MHLNTIQKVLHSNNVKAGWWQPPVGVDPQSWAILAPPIKLALAMTELAEALEGHRRGVPDDHLPHHPMLQVEIVDAIIRLLDLAEYLRMDTERMVVEKLEYNSSRPDHTLAVRNSGGKLY